jgi:uncharacterized protein with WD repeat
MGRKPGSRLTGRKIKRELAKSTRDTKYANQKGGGSNSKRRIGRKRSDPALDLPDHLRQADEDDDEDANGEEQDVLDDDKAIRAFTKKLRQIEDLKRRKQLGEPLNEDQLAKLSQERAVLKKILDLTASEDGAAVAQEADEAKGNKRAGRAAKRRKA